MNPHNASSSRSSKSTNRSREPALSKVFAQEVPVREAAQRSYEAFCRDLPELLQSSRLCYVAYHMDEKLAVSDSKSDVMRQSIDRGYPAQDVFVYGIIEQLQDIVFSNNHEGA